MTARPLLLYHGRMKLLTFRHPTGPRPATLVGTNVALDLPAADPELPRRWNELFAHLDRVAALSDRWRGSDRIAPDGATGVRTPLFAVDAVQLLPPVPEPSKIIAVGLNYRDHAEEQKRPLPRAPLLFCKAPSCLQAAGGPILLDDDLDQVDAEAELAVVIGRAGRGIPRREAPRYIAGYTCFNDISDRAAQYADKQWFRGKSIDTGGPCGPWIVTPDELPPLARGLAIQARWNGLLMQDSNTDQLIFGPDELISHASRHMTLLAGDIIATGTPGGVGVFRDPPQFLRPGDMVEVSIQKIGALANPVVGI
jgi:2,4-diketo-3-deoxy-L-fuconate hydrolase